MNFAYKPSPHIRSRMTTKSIMNHLLIALVFVAIWGIINQYLMFGPKVALNATLMIIAACLTGVLTHFSYNLICDKFNKVSYSSFDVSVKHHINLMMQGVPLITGIIIALTLPANTPIYVVIISTVFAELFAKLLFGGFGQNIFNPAATGRVLATVAFGSLLVVPTVTDAVTTATPLANAASQGWFFSSDLGNSYVESFGGFANLFFGTVPGAIGETARLAILIAMIYLIYKKVIDWTVPAFYLGTIFLITLLVGLYFGLGFWYPVFHLLSGGLMFAAVFMATDPVTNPINRQGRIIFSILLAMFTLLLRFSSNYPEGAVFAIMFMNMFVPFIDAKTANITTENSNKKWMSVILTIFISILLVFAFTFNMKPISDNEVTVQAIQ